jgi:plasmid stability protein
MKKTSVYLDESLDRALAVRAAEEGMTKADFIRRALDDAIGRSRRPRPSIIGVGGSGETDLSTRVDELLTEVGFGS